MSQPKGTILVTGSNGGLGATIVKHIVTDPSLARNHHGLYTVRKVETANTVRPFLEGRSGAAATKHQYDLVPLDLSSLKAVRAVADQVNSRVARREIPPIRALILNAAYQEHAEQTFTEDGFDMTNQCNYLSHFLLTLLLLKSMDKEEGRIVVLGSWSHEYVLSTLFVLLIS